MKPVIGITPSSQLDTLPHGSFQRYVLSDPYVRAVERSGGIALILPPQHDAVAALLRIIDGLLLSGGPDVDPARYGDSAVHPATYGIDPERDQFEIDLFDGAVAMDVPVLGICRGIQVINVALGGTLIQDVATEHPGANEVGHRQHERGLEVWQVGHSVTAKIDAQPLLTDLALGVNSFHHQAIRDLAPRLEPAAYSPDGLIEAVVMPDSPGVCAVQWHPELMFERDEAHLRPFVRLVQAAATRRMTSWAV
jgi:putative glutamine amidotransferase